jgi:hypothetical protein
MTNQSIHTFWDLIKTHRIEIPIIQRDYAQGRNTNETKDIRTGFVNELHKALCENGETLHLNFIYGKIKGIQNAQQLSNNKAAVRNMLNAVKSYSQTLDLNIDFKLIEQQSNTDGTHYTSFIPLDGQQRLTTLYLLHWYLLKRLNKLNELKQLNNFSYKIRPSSKDFCEALITNDFTIKSDTLSEQIKDSNWYFLHWSKDPTVKGMLNMLDTIHATFQDKKSLKTYWSNLKKGQIRFEFLDLDNFSLTDELYIKMNARGKHLTPFENFKAWLMEYVVENNITIAIENWERHFDITWADLFWNNKGDNEFTIDQAYLNFFRNMFQIFYVQQNPITYGKAAKDQTEEEKGIIENIRKVAVNKLNDNYVFVSNQFYEDLTVLTKTNIDLIFEIIHFLADKSNGINQIKKDLAAIDFFNNDRSLFKAFVNGSMSYPDKVRFYGMMLYLLKHKDDDYSKTAFVSWMRVVRNLVENTTIDSIVTFARAIDGIVKLSEKSNAIYSDIDVIKNSRFSDTQIKEEVLKIKLINETVITEDSFLEFENHAYFRGKVNFLLNMLEEDEEEKAEEFETLGSKAAAIFNYKLKEGGDTEYLLERAMLTIDYEKEEDDIPTSYLRHFRQNRWSFVKMANNRSKRISTWRNDFLPNCVEYDYFHAILNAINKGDEINGLRYEIENHQLSPNDWRYHIVNHIENIDYCSQGFIRFNNKQDILLYKESQSNHYHCELFSSGFYETYRKKIEAKEFNISPFTEFWYHEVKSASHIPCAVLDDFKRPNDNHYAIDISYQNRKYLIKFFNRKEDSEIEPIVMEKLETIEFGSHQKFKLEESEGLNKLIVTTSGEKGVEMYLNQIFEKLKEFPTP